MDLSEYFKGVGNYEPGPPAAPPAPFTFKAAAASSRVPARKASKKAKPANTKKVSRKGAAASTRRARTAKPGTTKAAVATKMGPVKYFPAQSRARFQKPANASLSKKERTSVARYYSSLLKLPIFLISGHSCICPDSGKCLGRDIVPGPKAPPGTTPATFAIPSGTILMSIAQAGDLCYLRGVDPERLLYNQRFNFRDYLVLHSAAELKENAEVGVSKFSLYAGILRGKGGAASQPPVLWPNQNFSFEEKDVAGVPFPDNENGCGVYELTAIRPNAAGDGPADPLDLRQTRSIIKQTEVAAGDGNMFTSDIIQETYRRTGHTKGIFILYGCLGKCVGRLTAIKGGVTALDKAARTMYAAENAYKGKYGPPLLTRGELAGFKGIRLAENKALVKPPVSFAAEELAELVEAGAMNEENAKSVGSAYAEAKNFADLKTILEKTAAAKAAASKKSAKP